LSKSQWLELEVVRPNSVQLVRMMGQQIQRSWPACTQSCDTNIPPHHNTY